MNRFISFIAFITIALFLVACGNSEPDLTITSFTDELQDVIDIFEEEHDVDVELQIIPTENYTTTLQPALESGKGAPDVFTGEIVYLKQWIEQDYWETLSQDPYNVDEWEDDYIDYVWDLGINTSDRKSTRLNSSHVAISYAVFCLKKKIKEYRSDILVQPGR